jgi:hypothetical protein
MNTGRSVALAGLILTAGIVAGICWAAAGTKLYVDGKLASSRVVIVDGRAYVPVVDVAEALGMTVGQVEDGYALTREGGANQVEGVAQGGIGDELFTGKWRFQVLSVEQGRDQYTERYYQQERSIKPNGADEELIVVNCRVKNATEATVSPILTERLPGDTALADDAEHSYAPIDYDARQEINKTQSYAASALLPGAAAEFALAFSVPKGTHPKALVFSLMAYPNDVGRDDHTNVRVELSGGNSATAQ